MTSSVTPPGPDDIVSRHEFASRHDANSRRIAIIGKLDEHGGVQSVILSLIRGLNNNGIIPDIIWDEPPNPSLLKEKHSNIGFQPVHFTIPTHILDNLPPTIRYFVRPANAFSDLNITGQYDFYYIFYNGFILTQDRPHLRYLSGPPLLPQLEVAPRGIRGIPFRSFRWIYKNWLRNTRPIYEFHHNSRYVINSQFTAELFEEAHGVRLPVIHPPIDLTGRSYSPGDLEMRDTITYFSRFAEYKRPEMLLLLAGRYPQYRFVLMGGVRPQFRAYFESIRKSADSAGLRSVEMIDNPSNQKIREELSRTRFFVFPAINEHFGIATAEAIASGAIPYVHDSGGQREIVPDSRLRFQDASFLDGFHALLQLSNEELIQIQARMSDHIHGFSEDTFIEKMLSFIR